MTDSAKKIRVWIFGVFFLLIVLFAFARSTDLIFGVKIREVNLKDGAVLKESILKIIGNAKNAVNLTLNGREISIDLEGDFSETIALLPGYNTVNLKAIDKFGYQDEKNYKLIYLEE